MHSPGWALDSVKSTVAHLERRQIGKIICSHIEFTLHVSQPYIEFNSLFIFGTLYLVYIAQQIPQIKKNEYTFIYILHLTNKSFVGMVSCTYAPTFYLFPKIYIFSRFLIAKIISSAFSDEQIILLSICVSINVHFFILFPLKW